MKITTTSWLGFLVTLSALNIPAVTAINPPTTSSNSSIYQPLESRLYRLSTTLKARENSISDTPLKKLDDVAIGWADGRGSRGFVNLNRGGWGNGYRGGFANRNPWRNGWGDRGGFRNYGGGGFANRGGGFANRSGGGGFVNRGGGFVNR